MVRRMLMVCVLCSVALWIAAPMVAAYEGDVIIGQEVVLRIRFPAGGMTIQERSDIITGRINELLGSKPFNPEDVTTGIQNKEWVVLIGGNLIITADKPTAEYNKTTPQQLADMWAANLRRVIPRAKSESEAH
jgi:hypothetical protein